MVMPKMDAPPYGDVVMGTEKNTEEAAGAYREDPREGDCGSQEGSKGTKGERGLLEE